MTRTLNASEAGRLLKAALKATYPGVQFAVRRGRGTGAGWLHVAWIDGPRSQAAVQDIADRYTGRRFDGMTDGYESLPPRLVAFDDGLPTEVKFRVDGVNVYRQMGPDGIAAVAAEVRRVRPAVDPYDPVGRLSGALLDAEATEHLTRGVYTTSASVRDVSHIVHSRTDLYQAASAS